MSRTRGPYTVHAADGATLSRWDVQSNAFAACRELRRRAVRDGHKNAEFYVASEHNAELLLICGPRQRPDLG